VYFDLVPTLIATALSLIPVHVKRVVFYDDSVSSMVISCVIAIIWQLTWILMIHLVITKVGMVYVEAEVLREGNDQTLDNLDEGVVILDEKEMKIRYFNKAASVSQ